MDFRLFFTLLNYKRIPYYFTALLYAKKEGVLGFKRDFKGMLSLPEGITLHKLAKSLPKNSIMLEIGCYGGLSSAFLLAGTQKNKAFLYSIDPFNRNLKEQKESIGKYQDEEYKKVEIIHASNKPSKEQVEKQLKQKKFNNFELIAGYSHEVIRRWRKKIDLLWIDGNHERVAVEKDFIDWTQFLKKGGVIAFHDANKTDKSPYWKWGWDGPTKIVNKYLKGPKWINVKRIDSLVYATKNF